MSSCDSIELNLYNVWSFEVNDPNNMKGELLTDVGIGRLTIVIWSLKRHKKNSDANLGNIRLNGHLCKR